MSEELRMGETTTAPKLNPKTPNPSPTKAGLERAGGWLICAGAAIACGIALFDFGTWWWWHDWRIGAASNTVPMAPSTALMLLILGGALLLRLGWGAKAAVRLIGFAAAGIAAVPAVILGIQRVTGVELAWEHLLMSSDDTVRGMPVGHLSPLSAGAFLLAAISLAALLPPLAGRRWFHRTGLVAAAAGAVGTIIIALAYASGTPLFYGGGTIPMAFLTAIALAALNLALLTAAVSAARQRDEGASAPPLPPTLSWRGKERNLFIVVGVLALGIALVGFFFLRAQQAAMRGRIADQLAAIADLKVDQIVNWRNERLAGARLLMQSPSLARNAAELFAQPDSAAASADMLAYLRALQTTDRYERVVLFDLRMHPRLAVPPTAETSGSRLSALLEAAPTASDVLVSDLHREDDGGLGLDLVVPLRDIVASSAGQNPELTQSVSTPIGAMLLLINPRDYLYPLIQKWPLPSETGETLLVRREGEEMVYLNDLPHQRGSALTLRRSIHDQQLPAAMGGRGLFGVTEGVDYRGVAVLAAVRPVPGTPWILVAKEDQAEIYTPMRRQAWFVGAIVTALLLGAAFAAAYSRRQTTMDFLRRELAAEAERGALAERLALVTQHANDIIFLMDETRRIVEANDRALTTYGYTLEELRQLPPGSLRAPAALDSRPHQIALFELADSAVFETVHQRKDGTTFPVEVSGRSVEVEGRQFSMAIIRDITARKQAEEALDLKSAALEAAANGIVITDRAGLIEWVNPAFAALTGYSAAEAIGKNPGKLIKSGRHDQEFYRHLWETVLAGKIWQGEIVNRRKDGGIYTEDMTVTPVRNRRGEIAHFIAIKQDVTARKRAEGVLKLFRDLVQDSSDAIGMATPEGKHYYQNAAFDHLFGEIGQNPPDSVFVDPVLGKKVFDTIMAGGIWQGEVQMFGKDRAALEILLRTYPIKDQAGQIVGLVGLHTDITERKQDEKARRHREAELKESQRIAQIGSWEWTPATGVVAWSEGMNHVLTRAYGSPAPTFETLPQFYTPESWQRLGVVITKALETGAPYNLELEMIRPDGASCWTTTRGEAIRGTDGTVVKLRGTVLNITELKQADAALQQSEELYRSLFANMLNGYAYCRMIFSDGRPVDFVPLVVNRSFTTLLGLKDVVGKNASVVIPGLRESDPELLEGFGRVALSGVPEQFEHFGKILGIWLSFSVYSPAKEHVVVVFDVITARKKAEAALRESEERYRLLFENNPLSMWVYDLESLRFLAVNESAVQHYGYTREEFLAMTIEGIRPEEDIPALRKSAAEGWAERLGTSEWRHRRKDGAIIQVEIRSRPLIFNGREARLVLATDITEKKLFEEKFLHAQRLESIGMLAAGIAHDLNNVLAPIVFAAPLLRGSLSAPRDLKILDTLERSAGRGAGLVKQILGFAHSTTGEFQSTQVKHLLRDIIGVIEETFPKSIQLEHQIPSALWPVEGNATQIHQVIMNLCVNARDAMPSGGTLRLTAANRRLDSAEADAMPGARPGAWLMLEVGDTGTGIAPEVLERIWTPFFTTKGIGKGTGLGLATVRGIVASHHGFVELDTKVGRGSAFRVFLPAVVSESPRPSSATPVDTPDGHGELILVADDDKAIRDLVTEILGSHGYRVLSCADGMEAITLIYARPSDFSLVVTDADMPRLDGVALMRAVLQMRPDIRFLAMSGLSSSGTEGTAVPEIQKAAHAFLLKPFTPGDLLATVHRLLHPTENP